MSNKDDQSPQKLPPAEGEVLSDEDVKKLPKDVQRKIVTMVQASYSGPIPPASEIAKYEKTQKGSAKRIIGMAETALDAEIKDRWWHNVTVFWGMLTNKLLLFVLIGLSAYLVMNGKEIAALLAGALPLLQLFTNIDFGHKNKPTEQAPAKKEQPKPVTKKKAAARKKKSRKK